MYACHSEQVRISQDVCNKMCSQDVFSQDEFSQDVFIVQDGIWNNGHLRAVDLPGEKQVWDIVDDALNNNPGCPPRLCVTDGAFPNTLPAGINTHHEMPGQIPTLVPCITLLYAAVCLTPSRS